MKRSILCQHEAWIMPPRTGVLVLLLFASHFASAHPLDSYAIDQYVDIRFLAEGIRLVHRVEFAEIPTVAELPKVDLNSDLALSDAEVDPYLSQAVKSLLGELRILTADSAGVLQFDRGEVFLEGIPVPRLRVVTTYTTPFPAEMGEELSCQFELLHRSQARGDRQIRLVSQGKFRLDHISSSEEKQPPGMAPPFIGEASALVYGRVTRWSLFRSEKEYNPAVPEIQSRPSLAVTDANPFLSLNPRGFDPASEQPAGRPSPATGPLMVSASRSGSERAPALSGEAAPVYQQGASSKPGGDSWADRNFRGLFHSRDASFSFLLFASLLAFIYGAVHALEPGHGKTIVAAYLIGSRGTIHHAVLLALIVTFTHTFSVYLLGILALTNLDRVQGTYLPWLECGSWALIVAMGVGLFLRYYRAYILGQLADPDFHTHGFGGTHSHSHHHHRHDHEHGHQHPHDHEHSHDHPHSHNHDDHPHDEGHSHHDEEAVLMVRKGGEDQVRWVNLLTLGITGGIVPCPGALFVMMLALTSGRAGVGLYLITVFSAGLAAALMTVGIVMVRSRSMMDRFAPNGRVVQILPLLSSLVIVMVGAGFLVNGLLKHGIIQIGLS
jgi:nickel/cobalt exporter